MTEPNHRSSYGLALKDPLTAVSAAALASTDPFENPPTPELAVGTVENMPLSDDPNAASWQIVRMMSRAKTRWITLRADFDGNGGNDPGLFDRYNSLFLIGAGASTKVFRFGARDGLFWPLAGDWNSDGTATVGVYTTKTATAFLTDTLAAGAADTTLTGPVSGVPHVVDSPLVWHTVNPAARYAIKWEALPSDRDCGYTCQGVPRVLPNSYDETTGTRTPLHGSSTAPIPLFKGT